MTKNVTLRVDEELLKKCRHAAVESEKSLSQWVVDVLKQQVDAEDDFEQARQNVLQLMNKGYYLGGKPLTRDEAHVR